MTITSLRPEALPINSKQTFGNYITAKFDTEEYLVLGFSPGSLSIQQRWRNNGLSADFLSDYMTTFFPGASAESDWPSRLIEFKSAVNYIANELLENAMKFNDERSGLPIDVQLQLHSQGIIFQVSNSILEEHVEGFQIFIQELLSADISDLYVAQLEKSANDEEFNGSGLGLITMIQDYNAELGWQFEVIQNNPAFTIVRTMVQLSI
jgi:hypothetical protein